MIDPAPWLCTMVGMRYKGTMSLVSSLRPGTKLGLKRDPCNPSDPNAIEIWLGETMLAFVKAKEAAKLAPVMDSKGISQCDGTLSITADRWPQIEVILP